MALTFKGQAVIRAAAPKWISGTALAAYLIVASLFLSGCTTERVAVTGGGSVADSNFITGNWVIQFTPTSGGTPFTQLAGFMDEARSASAGKNNATAALQGQTPDACYAGANVIPLFGSVTGATVFFYSFDVNGQYLTINATKNSGSTQITGTYSVGGGCDNGAAGTLTGTRYAVLDGTYSGSVTANAAQTLQLKLTQNTTGTGDGTFFVSGSAAFQGFSCFTTGTMAGTSGSIIGNAVQLALTTNDVNGSQVILTGSIDPAADTLTIASANVQGGDCSGSLGGATLTLQ
jgi:hypothetical protein